MSIFDAKAEYYDPITNSVNPKRGQRARKLRQNLEPRALMVLAVTHDADDLTWMK